MPPKISPNDWDRSFRRGAPRRGGPLRALVNLLIIAASLILIGIGALALRIGVDRAQESAAAAAEATATNTARRAVTATARALEQATTAPAAAVATPTAASEQAIGRSSVARTGNLRNQPLLSPETVVGLICEGDQLEVLEQTSGAEGAWYRVRLTQAAADCSPQRVTIGSIGWASASILAPVTP